MKAKDMRAKQPAELQAQVLELLKEQFNLRMQKGSGQAFRSSDMKRVRRDIARTKTIIHEMKAGKPS